MDDHEMTEEEHLLYCIYTGRMMMSVIRDGSKAYKKAEKQVSQWERKLKQLQKKGK